MRAKWAADAASWVWACATRSPATFSCRSALTTLTRSRASAYATDESRRKTTVATTRIGITASATRASSRSVTSSAVATPTSVSRATTAWASPVCRNVESASTSVVIRVMIRPPSSRS